jgi:succinate dehydrogenase/fumarate reductase flavoprotein subunit
MSGDDKDDKKGESYGLTRRDFVKVGAITAATLALPTILNNVGAKSMAQAGRRRLETDVLIIGSGFAGTFAAIEARRQGLGVVMLDKGTVGWSGMSPWASDSRPFDKTIYDRDEWRRNIATNTEWINNRDWLEIFMDESLEIFDILHRWGAHEVRPFERSRVFRDQLEHADVNIVERVLATSLLQDPDGRVGGAVGFTFDDSRAECSAVVVLAKAVILCTGAGAYKSPGFPNWGLTFDGDAMAYAAGAAITGKEFHDTHVTFSRYPAASYDGWQWAQTIKGAYIMVGAPDPVTGGLTINGALRASQGAFTRLSGGGPGGEAPGAHVGPNPEVERNRKYLGKGFLARPGLTLDLGGPPAGAEMPDYGFRVGGATAGMGVHKGEGVFSADCTCRAEGVEGLYAAGDALGSMLCGTSYPARGFSSYGSAIQGRRAAAAAAEFIRGSAAPRITDAEITDAVATMWAPRENRQGFSPEWVTQVLRNTMTPFHILYVKEPRRLEGALASIEYLRKQVVPRLIARDGHELRLAHETSNMLLNAEMKLRSGLYRTESRGTHFREDFPARNDAEWFCWVLIRKDSGGEMALSRHPLPDSWRPDPSLTYRERYPRPYPGEDEFLASQHGA